MIFVLRAQTFKFSDTHRNTRSKVGTRYSVTRPAQEDIVPLTCPALYLQLGDATWLCGIAAARGGFRGHPITQLAFTAAPYSVIPNHFSLTPSLPLPSSNPELPNTVAAERNTTLYS